MLTKMRAVLLTASLVASSFAVPVVAYAQEAETPPAASEGRFQGIVMDTITGVIGVSQGDVISQVRTGGTIAELAEENGTTGQAVVDALMAHVDERLAEAVASGGMTQDEADEKRAEILDRFTNLVFEVRKSGNPGIGNGEIRTLLMDTIEDTLGVNQGQLVSHVRTGGTLAELAEENGSSGPELEAALVGAISSWLDTKVADGEIDETQAAQFLERATERIGEIVYKVHQPGNGR